MPHSVAQTVATALLLIGDLSSRWGLWRSDAAGIAQYGSGEAAFLLPLYVFLIPNLYSHFLLLHSSVILDCLSPSFLPSPPLSVSVSL